MTGTRRDDAARARVERVKQSADLLAILGCSQQKRAASTNGGEWGTPCIWCGGDDRFRVWPRHPDGPRAWCRRCGRGGDAFDLINELQGLGFLASLDYLERYSAIATPAVLSGASRAPKAASDSEMRRAALRIWREAGSASNTVVETYLRSRAITLAVPPTIRYSPALWHTPTETERPALVAAVALAESPTPIAIHRTYLRSDGSGKADVEKQRLALGGVGGGSVHLAPAGDTMAVCEGIESALSFMQASELPTWAALSTSGVEGLILPPMPLASVVVIGADNDENNAGVEAASRAAARWTAEGRAVRIALPPNGLNDWNDALREAARR